MKLLNCGGKLLDLSSPRVMGILNFTPDSFYAQSRTEDESQALRMASRMLVDGASILDIGAQSTRPGADFLDAEEEWNRLEPVLKALRRELSGAILSVDTFHPTVAQRAIEEGAEMINDVSGGTLGEDGIETMFDVIARNHIAYVLMHMQGTPQNMQLNPQYENVTSEILKFMARQIHELRNKGVSDIVVDPGFGFGKSLEHNYELLTHLDLFHMPGCPLLAGLSRKSMITKVLEIKSDAALNGTTVLNTVALMKGADILRVHDVKEAVEAIQLMKIMQ